MIEAEIIAQWEFDRPIYAVWAKFVCEEITTTLQESIQPLNIDEFLKVPIKPRLKDTKSLIDKALFRNKAYENPYTDITDKVGMRFVVLLTSDIRKIEQTICGSSHWIYSKDRDYEDERKEKPLEFAYQSVHYIVRAVEGITCEGVSIPAGTPCEIQVRTLLQHAHCELTHDSIYKNKRTASAEIQRTVAKSMALIEAVDDFFEIVMDDLDKATELERNSLKVVSRIYTNNVKLIPEKQKSNLLIIDAFIDKIDNDLERRIEELLNSKQYISERIAARAIGQHLYRQPAILIVYLMATTFPAVTKERWPLTLEELRPVYCDLGLSVDNY